MWGSNTFYTEERVEYGYSTDTRRLSEKLVIAADLLHRAHERDSSRTGLLLEEQKDVKNAEKKLPLTLINPDISSSYKLRQHWTTLPIHRFDPILKKEKCYLTRKLGRAPASRMIITRLKRIRNEKSIGASFAILSALQLSNELFLRIDPDSVECIVGNVIQVSDLHSDIDGMLLVQSIKRREIVAVPPLANHQRCTPEYRSFEDLSNARACVVASVDDSRSIYHLKLLGINEKQPIGSNTTCPPPVPQQDEEDALNPFLHINPRSTDLAQGMDPSRDGFIDSGSSRDLFVMKCVQSIEARRQLISLSFHSARIESSLKALLYKFGIQKISTTFDTVLQQVKQSKMHRGFSVDILPYIQKMDQLIETPYQRMILKKVETGQNWLFMFPLCHIKVTTYLHLIKCLFQIQPRSKVLVLVESMYCAERLNKIINLVSKQFGLDQVRMRPVILPGDRKQPKNEEAVPLLIAPRNVIISTTDVAEHIFNSGLYQLKFFAMIIWDQCEHMMKNDPGHAISSHYKSIQLSESKLPRVQHTTLSIH
eukprot:g5168.t1